MMAVIWSQQKTYPDFTAFDPHHEHSDPKSDPANPRWWMVDVTFVRKFTATLTLGMLRERVDLHDLIILRRGNRLSITPVTPAQWRIIRKRSFQAVLDIE